MRRTIPRRVVLWASLACAALAAVGDAVSQEDRPGVPASEASRRLGRRLFLRAWAPGDPRAGRGDGLGPVFNARSCVACHGLAGPGGGGTNDLNVELLAAIPLGAAPLAGEVKPAAPDRSLLTAIHPGFAESGSIVLHRFGTSPDYPAWRADAKMGQLTAAALLGAGAPPPSSRRGAYKLPKVTSDFRMLTSFRNSPALFGSGRIDAIPEAAIEAEAKRQAGEVAAGRVSRLKDGRVGRFGWKAQVPGLEEFVLTACANEMGLEVPGHHQAPDPLGHDDGYTAEADMSGDDCVALVGFVRSLAAPGEWKGGDWRSRGRAVFEQTGCADCHRPNLGGVDGLYSDLLVHDMGPGLNDSAVYYGREEESSPGTPKSPEWRTPPLWGVADSAPYLHDGRAPNLAAAIKLHGGQAKSSADRFHALRPDERAELLGFLNSLRVRKAAKQTERDRLLAYEESVPTGSR